MYAKMVSRGRIYIRAKIAVMLWESVWLLLKGYGDECNDGCFIYAGKR